MNKDDNASARGGRDLSASHPAPDAAPHVADCGCVYHAEQGIPCEHDKAQRKAETMRALLHDMDLFNMVRR